MPGLCARRVGCGVPPGAGRPWLDPAAGRPRGEAFAVVGALITVAFTCRHVVRAAGWMAELAEPLDWEGPGSRLTSGDHLR